MANISFVDSEVNGRKQIIDLGAIKDSGSEFHSNNPKDFKEFVKNSDFVVGHNIVHHDLLYIDKLLPNKCDIIQGYYLSKPLPLADFETLIQKELIK